jgi:cytochrome c-type biogenesis protein
VLTVAYKASRGIPFLLAALSVSEAMSSFSWARQNARVALWTGGGMLVVLGLFRVGWLWLELVSRLQGVIANWQVPL